MFSRQLKRIETGVKILTVNTSHNCLHENAIFELKMFFIGVNINKLLLKWCLTSAVIKRYRKP